MPAISLGGGMILAWGTMEKGTETIDVDFEEQNAEFDDPPHVVVSSEWAAGPVGGAETIKQVKRGFFTCHSGNVTAGQPYYVRWMAIGAGSLMDVEEPVAKKAGGRKKKDKAEAEHPLPIPENLRPE